MTQKQAEIMRWHISLFAEQIRATKAIDELIKEESFRIDSEHTGYLYAYKTGRGVHIDAGASVGSCSFASWNDMYCGHTLHEYLGTKAIADTDITLESRIERLLNKTIAQLDILAPIARKNATKSGESIL